MDLLPFQRDIVQQIRTGGAEAAAAAESGGGGLWIVAAGLGLQDIIQAALIAEEHEAKAQAGTKPIILVLNCAPEELWRFPAHRYTFVNTELPSSQRSLLYQQGGLVFGSSRILVVDLLKRKLTPQLVSTIVVMNAHSVSDSSTEAFILRLCAGTSRVWAFSDRVHNFVGGFSRIGKSMSALGVTKLFLWPRFRQSVKSSLQQHAPDVVQLYPKMTHLQTQIHAALLSILGTVIAEINKPLNNAEGIGEMMAKALSVENSLFRSFHDMLRAELEPQSNRLSYKTRQLIRDLDALRKLLIALQRYDAVTFYALLQKAKRRDFDNNNNNNSSTSQANMAGWLLLDEAEVLFKAARARLWTVNPPAPNSTTPTISFECEDNPKWSALREVVQEAVEQNGRAGSVLIVVKEPLEADLLTDYLQSSSPRLHILKRLGSTLQRNMATMNADPTLLQSAQAEIDAQQRQQNEMGAQTSVDNTEGYHEYEHNFGIIGSIIPDHSESEALSAIVIVAVREGGTERSGLLLRELRHPSVSCVVLFDPEQSMVREVECFQSRHPNRKLRVYFMITQDSIEEQKYLASVKKEQSAFEQLVREKAQMAFHDPKDMDRTAAAVVSESVKAAQYTQQSTRKGGFRRQSSDGDVNVVGGSVVVDVREFRSKLPGLLYAAGLEVIPKTLLVSDYILTPDIAAERKSVSDLFQSFSSGRLVHQIEQMCRNFSTPILLIEFDHSEVFMLQDRAILQGMKLNPKKKTNSTASSSSSVDSDDSVSILQISGKLALLTLHFPQLRILWSRSPYETAQLFQDLKQGQPQPNLIQAAKFEASDEAAETNRDFVDDAAIESADRFAPADMVKQMPGVSQKNASRLLGAVAVATASSSHLAPLSFRKTNNEVDPPLSLVHLIQYSQQQLTDLLGSVADAKKLWTFLHSQAAASAPTKDNPKAKSFKKS
jgi:DNA excision repair protein ERCC-4